MAHCYLGHISNMLTADSGVTDMTPEQQEQEDFTIADIPSFPDDFNIDDMNRQWEEMNKR